MHLILASTSIYRKELLNRLRLPFEQVTPDFEEAKPDSLAPEALVKFNTMGKANSVLSIYPDASVIASDQVAVCSDMVLGKPGDIASACEQLHKLSGKRATFLTGLTLQSATVMHFDIIPFQVFFRNLCDAEIQTYVNAEQPLDCAGSFKSEGLGISLFERMQGNDPTALIGLPLIRLSQWLHPLRRLARKRHS